jgi:hypothetical protein
MIKLQTSNLQNCFPQKFPAENFPLPVRISIGDVNKLAQTLHLWVILIYAKQKIWINEDSFLTSDIQNIGVLIRENPRKVSSRDFLASFLYNTLSNHPLSAKASNRYHEAKESLPFHGTIPNFKLRNTENI